MLQQAYGSVLGSIYSLGNMMTRATANTAAAIVIWLVGAWATSVNLNELGIVGPVVVYAFILQSVLTIAQGPVWRKHLRYNQQTGDKRNGAVVVGIGSLIIDVLLNVGGFWVYVQNLGNTTLWQAVMAATNQPMPPTAQTCFALAVLLALATSSGPEALWDL